MPLEAVRRCPRTLEATRPAVVRVSRSAGHTGFSVAGVLSGATGGGTDAVIDVAYGSMARA